MSTYIVNPIIHIYAVLVERVIYEDEIIIPARSTITLPVYTLLFNTTRSTVVIRVKHFQNELMVEIYSKSLVRVISKVLRMKCS